MVSGPTEVVFQVRLPESALATLTRQDRTLRIVAVPTHNNGAGHPDRYLLSATATRLDLPALTESLATLLRGIRTLRHDGTSADLMADVDPTLGDLVSTALSTLVPAGHDATPDVIHRPALIKDGTLFVSAIIAGDARLEEGIAATLTMLRGRGIAAHLDRIGPAPGDHVPSALYEDALTPKQTEIVRVALALGLYDTPRRCTLDTIAEIFGISKAAAHNRMKGAERKILAQYFS